MVAGGFLGVDFGVSKIGLAIADGETRMAFAYSTLANDKLFWEKIRQIVANENIGLIVVGLTRHEKDEKSAKEKEEFAKMLEKEICIEVVFEDEAFTTKMAQDNIKMRGGKNIAKTDDQEAARIILQSWLDRDTAFEQSVEALKSTRPS